MQTLKFAEGKKAQVEGNMLAVHRLRRSVHCVYYRNLSLYFYWRPKV